VSVVTADALREADVFVVTGMDVTLSAEEVCLLDTFVARGGAVLSFRNEWTSATLLGSELGATGETGQATIVDAASPVIAGPFGTVASQVRLGWNTEYLTTGPGWPVLAQRGRVVLMTFGVETGHVGRGVLVGDEEMFLNGPTPFGAMLYGTQSNNQLLFANIIDYLLGAPGLDAEGEDALDACSDADLDGSNDLDDCDDFAAHVHPGAPELLDGADNDCDGEVDEGLDGDGDGVPDLLDACNDTTVGSAVDPRGCAVVCESGGDGDDDGNYDADGDGTADDQDCAAQDPAVHPGAPELPGNYVDEDCDGSLGECDPTAEWRNHREFVSCVVREAVRLIKAGVLTLEEALDLIGDAARSNVGKPPGDEAHGD
jgi:hypothetical protein